jgi:hypothetical protein
MNKTGLLKIYFAITTITLLCSCEGQKKDALNEQINSVVSNNGRIEDQDALVTFAKTQESSPIRGYHNDAALDTTKAIGSTELMNKGSILFIGNSLFRNFKDDTAWRYMSHKWDVVDRGISGSMAMDAYRNREPLIYYYGPRQVVLYFIENEESYYRNTGYPAGPDALLNSITFEYGRLFDDIRLRLPNCKISVLEPNHAPVNASYNTITDSVTRFLKKKVLADKYASFIETNGINDDPIYYKSDLIHFLIPSNAYGRWASLIKPHLIKRGAVVPADTTTIDPLGPTAIAGPDQTIPVSWKYCRLNANASTSPTGWISRITWEQLSGPTVFGYSPTNQGNTLLSASVWVAGEYTFRCKVADNLGRLNYDTVKITFTAQ